MKNIFLDFLFLRSLRTRARAWHMGFVFDRAMKKFVASPELAFDPENSILGRLMYGWGNYAYAAEHHYLAASLRATDAAQRPILECGSGLSTVLAGIVAKRNGNRIWALEHHPAWAERVLKTLAEYGIDSVELLVKPLRDYGEFDWYDVSVDDMPNDFDVVLCDGPPGHTRGGRYGCLAIMRSRLSAGCTIVIDDAMRQEEQEMATRWAEELGTDFQTLGGAKPYIEIRVPAAVDSQAHNSSLS